MKIALCFFILAASSAFTHSFSFHGTKRGIKVPEKSQRRISTALCGQHRGTSTRKQGSTRVNVETVEASSSTGKNNSQLNRRERMDQILERDGFQCVWCRCEIDAFSATTDHVIPRIKGGPSWIENEVAACRRCNKQRGHKKPLDWLQECEEVKGWQPNKAVIARCLKSLDQAIQKKGGQRKARPYLATQLRRLNKDG